MSPFGYVKSIWVTNDTVYAGGPMLNVNQTFLKVFNGNDSWTTLGPDTLICPGTSYTINADPNFASYAWNTGATTSSITVNSAGNYWVTGTRSNNCKATDSIIVEFCTSVNEPFSNNIFNLNIFPNPIGSEINIVFDVTEREALSFELTNTMGQVIYTLNNVKFNAGKNEFKVNSEKMITGIYFLKISNEKNSHLRKIIKI